MTLYERMFLMNDYEEWTRGEIIRLRDVAQKATADADTLQRTLDKWIASQGRQNEPQSTTRPQEIHGLNGHAPTKRGRRPGHGDKNATALEKIKAASPNGLTTDELYSIFVEIYGAKYKRSSMRAMLWHQKDIGNLVNNEGRYVIAQEKAPS